MCISKLGQVVYGAVALGALVLILIAMFTPGWRQVELKLEGKGVTEVMGMDLLGWTCWQNNDKGDNVRDKAQNCVEWYKNRPTWEKVVVVLMFCALFASAAAFIWNLMTFCACFCRGHIHKPLSGLALNAALFLGVALAINYAHNRDSIEKLKLGSVDAGKIREELSRQGNVSYSFYMGCGALLLQIVNVVVGGLIICFADHCL